MPTVLILDDAVGERNRLSECFTAAGYTVLEAGNDWEGLRRLREGTIDVVLVSLLTLTHDGLASIRRHLQKFPRTKLFAMSQTKLSNGLAVLLAAEALNVRKIFPKPVDTEAILDAVRREMQLPESAPAGK